MEHFVSFHATVKYIIVHIWQAVLYRNAGDSMFARTLKSWFYIDIAILSELYDLHEKSLIFANNIASSCLAVSVWK